MICSSCGNVPAFFCPLNSHFSGLYFFQYCFRISKAFWESRVYLSFLPFAPLICISILLLSMSPVFNFITSPTLNPAEYTSIKTALCFTLSTDGRIFTDKIQEISIEVEITFDSFIAIFSRKEFSAEIFKIPFVLSPERQRNIFGQ